MSGSSYAPNEPSRMIIDEVTWLQGAFLGSLLCGVQITLSAMSFLAVLKQHIRRRLRIVLLAYIVFLCAVVTAGQQFSLLCIQKGFIESRNYPGGPSVFLMNQYSMIPVGLVSASLFVFSNWVTELLLVWRCKVVCTTGERPVWFGVIFPFVLLVAVYVTGSLYLYRLYKMVDVGYTIKSALVYSSLSLLLNVVVTSVIAGRLLLHRRRIMRQFGRGHGSNYASVATILIESASFYTGFLVLLIVCFRVNTPALNGLQQMAAQVQSIASLLIVYRIAQGKGWKDNDNVGVSSADWRGDSEPRLERLEPEVVDLEIVAGPVRTSVHAPSISSKEDETPASTIARSVDATLPLEDAV